MLTLTQTQFDAFQHQHKQKFLHRLQAALIWRLPSFWANRPQLFDLNRLAECVQLIEQVGFVEEVHVAALIAFAIEQRDGAIEQVVAHPALAQRPPHVPENPDDEEFRFRESFPIVAGVTKGPHAAFEPIVLVKPVHIGGRG